MKTIVELETKLSKYLFDDDKEITLNNDNINCVDFIVADLNKNNAMLYTNVIAPDDWYGNKYMFDGINWSLNPSFEEIVLE